MSLLGSTINDLKSTLSKHGGPAHSNRFAVYMHPPRGTLLNPDIQGTLVNAISGGGLKLGNLLNDPRDIAILCESCSLPGRQVTTLDYQSIRQSYKTPYGYLNSDVSFTFLLTNDYYVKKMFDRWIQSIIDTKKYRVAYQREYSTDVVIQQLNKKNLPIYGVRLKSAYPVTSESINLDNTAENTIQRMTVTMTFEDFEEEPPLGSAISSAKVALGGIGSLSSNLKSLLPGK